MHFTERCSCAGTDLKEADMKSLVRYIRSVYPDEQQEITRLVKEIDEDLYDMTPYPQTTLHPRPTVEPVCAVIFPISHVKVCGS